MKHCTSMAVLIQKKQTNKKTFFATADGIIIPRYVLQKAALHVKGPADIVSI